MKTIIQASHVENTEAIEAYILKKLSGLDRVLDPRDGSVTARVEVGMNSKKHKKGDMFFAEINLHTRERDYRSVEHGEDLYAAIDAMKDEITREVKSYRGKRRDVAKRSARTIKKRVRGE